MDQEISVSTPESVLFSHEPAGVGSRFVAGTIDIGIQLAMIMGVTIISGAWSLPLETISSVLSAWSSAATVILMFLIFWGYHILFEMLWNGQTPGKRAAGVRVLKDGGYPVGFLDSVVRNLLRLIDFLPFFYGVGALVVLCNSKCKRIGDFAAGTIVVKERGIAMPRSLDSVAAGFYDDVHFDGQRLANMHALSEAEFNVVRQFMERRHSIQKDARLALARKIAAPLTKKLGLQLEMVNGREEELLESIAKAYGKTAS